MEPREQAITKEFLRGCLDHSSAAVYAKDDAGRYLFFNKRFFELFGVDVLGKTDFDLFERPVAETFRALDREVMESGNAIDGEERVPSLEGDRIYWSVKFPLRDDTGKVFGLAGISSDITDRKQVERERDATLALLDTFLSRSPVGFAVLDRELRYVRLNETLASLNGVSVEAHIGRRVREILPDAPDALEHAIESVWTTGRPMLNLETALETQAVPSVVRSFLTSFYPIVIGGETIAVGAVLSEITEQKRVSEQLRRDAELRELFIGVLAHDLRTPLSAISMGANALMLRDDMPEVGVRGAQRILRSAQRMNSLIAQVLDFTRVRSGTGLELVRGPLDLAHLSANLLEEFQAAHPDRSFDLRLQGDLRGTWDGDRLGQVLSNLVSNAVHHGAVESPVVVSLEGRAESVLLEVENQGDAIPKELLGTLFEPFRRGRPLLSRGAADGLGLGLYIAERIVAAHRGKMRASSDERGTVFRVELPR
jgi:PAS domain S-box-containing protein